MGLQNQPKEITKAAQMFSAWHIQGEISFIAFLFYFNGI